MAYSNAQRNTIEIENATVLQHDGYAGHQYVMRLNSPRIASLAQPGAFVHLQCDPLLPMRRPMSIMRVSRQDGWFEILYKAHGHGTGLLAKRARGDTISVIGPIGVTFKLEGYRRRPLLIGGGVGIPPMLFLAEHMRYRHASIQPFVIMGSEVPFPFTARPSKIIVPGIPAHVIASMPLLEDWGIASRLASLQKYPGCFDGYVTDLARMWLDSLSTTQREEEVEVFACGPTPMLRAVQKLAADYSLPCQISLEEYMACAVGGCAGCAVRIETEDGPAMKRVCVDGPVFEARTVSFG
jgi:dihydroorotate dehydrogenase electron transfer subunit